MRLQKIGGVVTACALLLALLLAGCDNTPGGDTNTSTTTAAQTGATAAMPDGVTFPNWDDTTTTMTAATTTAPSTAPLRDLLGIVQNADGTLTDKSDGTVFIDDDLAALTGDNAKAHAAAGLVTVPHDMVVGAPTYVTAAADTAEAYLVYHIAGGIKDAAVTTRTPVEVNVENALSLFISADGENWQQAPMLSFSPATTDNGMTTRTNYFYFTATDVRFVKVQLSTDTACQLDRVRVGNVQKMHHPFAQVEDREAATFYVDPAGSDDNDGLSPETAFKTLAKAASRFFGPGDKLLLKRGATFEGGVTLRGLGLANRRIYVGAYGEGKDPIVAGGNTVLTVQMDHVTVENLEITNPNGLSAIALRPNHTGAVKGIIVQNCYIHDINNEVMQFTYSSGGINAEVRDATAPTWFEDLVIRQNTFQDLCRTAVYTTTVWASRDGAGWGSGGSKNYIDDNNGWWPAENMAITHNTMHRVQGDIIVVIAARNLRIAHNVGYDGFCVDTQDLSRIIHTQGTNRCAAGMWSINSNDVYVEYNEVGYMHMPAEGGDGEAFDIDAGHKRIFVQYNYSHHNVGGFLLICGTDSSNKISSDFVVRHNLSIAETPISTSNIDTPTDIYNNTFIMGDAAGSIISFYTKTANLFFRNNIFSGKNACKISIPSNYTLENIVFDNNIYTGGATVTDKVYGGRKEFDGPRWGVHILSTNRAVDGVFVANDLTFPEATSTRAAAIAAYTPQVKMDGAYKTPSPVDINGDPIETPFYGCVKY